MLRNLFIKNFILIKQLDLEFATTGLTVISGETGSGKSILLDALVFCLGGKIDANPDDEELVTVCAEFISSKEVQQLLLTHDIPYDDSIIIKRTQHRGRKKFFISDHPVTQKLVQELSGLLLEIHGQNAQTLLGTASNHRKLLDEYAGLADELGRFKTAYNSFNQLTSQRRELVQKQEEVVAEIEYLTHLVSELEAAAITEGEEQSLTEKQRLCKEKRQRLQRLESIEHQLQYEELCSAIAGVQKDLSRHFGEELDPMYQALDNAYNEFAIAAEELEKYKQNIIELEDDTEAIEERLYLIRDFARKYKVLPEQLPQLLEDSQKQLSNLSAAIASIEDLDAKIQQQHNHCVELAEELSKQRSLAAHKLQKRVGKEFALLHMKGAEFVIDLAQDSSRLKSTGYDDIRFVARTNQGGSLSPIDKIASGGELSRFMLAIKIALLEKGAMQTILFDEIDTGVGGAAASSVGSRLAVLGKAAQVIVITHQAQVAVFAVSHLKVAKSTTGSFTTTSVDCLSSEQTTCEIARMLSGKTITDKSLSAARELQELVSCS